MHTLTDVDIWLGGVRGSPRLSGASASLFSESYGWLPARARNVPMCSGLRGVPRARTCIRCTRVEMLKID